MRIPTSICLLLFTPGFLLQQAQAGVMRSAELRDWCQHKSEAYLRKKHLQPYNWTSSWWLDGETFRVEGRWRVVDGERSVHCQLKKGAAKRRALMEVETE